MKPDPAAKAPARAAQAAPSSRTKAVLFGLGLGIAVALACYGVGRLQGAKDASAAEDRAKAAGEKTAEAQRALAGEQARVQRLEARRRLHLALLALDDRNFGIAQQQVLAAGALLEKSKSDGDLAKLGSELSKEKLVATEDVGTQRTRLIGWARRLDTSLPPIEP